MSEKCANWLNYKAIRDTVADYNKMWGPHDEVSLDDLSEFNMTRNCLECNMRPQMPQSLEAMCQIMDIFKEPALIALEKVGMRRKCYKSEVP